MAWGGFNARGVTQNKTAGALTTLAPTQAIPVNAVAILVCVTDNISTAGGASNTHNVCDTQKNQWVRAFEFTNAAAAAAGITLSVWVSWLSTQLATTDSVYLVTTGNTTAHAIGLFEAGVAAGKAPGIVAFAASQQDATQNPTVTLGGLASQEYALLGVVAREADTAGTYVMDADYTERTKFGTTGGAAAADVSAVIGTRVATLTSDTFNPTGLSVAADVVTGLVALYEAPALSLTVSKIFTAGGRKLVEWSDKTVNEFPSSADVFAGFDKEVVKRMAYARYYAIDPDGSNPAVMVGRSIAVTNGRPQIVETR